MAKEPRVSRLLSRHTVILLPPSQLRDPDTKAVFVPTFTPNEQVHCLIYPEKASVSFETLGVMIKNPHTLLCKVTDAPKFTINARVHWGKRKFRVASPLQTFEMGTAADCGMVLLEELTKLESKS